MRNDMFSSNPRPSELKDTIEIRKKELICYHCRTPFYVAILPDNFGNKEFYKDKAEALEKHLSFSYERIRFLEECFIKMGIPIPRKPL